MQTDPTDDATLIDGTGSLVTYLAVSGTIDAFYLKGDGSQITNIALPSGLVSSSVQLGLSSTDSPTFSGLTIRGTLTAQQYVVSSSVLYVTQSFSSGSTLFGNSADDTHKFTGSVFIQGPLTVTGGITGSLFGSSSWSTYSITSSIANTASYIDPLFISASVAAQGLAGTSDWNQITNKPANIISGSGQRSILGLGENDSPTFANGTFNGNVVVDGTLTARTYVVSSSVVNYETMNISGSTIFGNTLDDIHQVTGSLKVTGSIFGNLIGTATTASYIDPLFISASAAYYGFNSGSGGSGTSDWNAITNKPVNLISGSGQRNILGLGESDSPRFSTLYATNGNFDGNVVVGGTLTARTYIISSSVVDYQTIQVSGSSKFGDSLDDTHQFTGSLYITGSVDSSEFVGNLTGTSSWATNSITASHALTASYALNANFDTGSFATTASNTFTGDQNFVNNTVIGDTIYSTIGGNPINLYYGISKGDIANRFGGIKISNYDWNAGNLASKFEIYTDSETQDFSTRRLLVDGFGNTQINSNVFVTGSLEVDGILTAKEFHTQYISASILYDSGSTKFGDTLDDIHEFTGSVSITGSFIVPDSSLPPSAIVGTLAVSGNDLWIYI
jgi:hypothetical protein